MSSGNDNNIPVSNKRRALSMQHKVFAIVSLFILISLLLLALSYLQSDIMNSVRSFVRGEGLWAKAQKDAVFHLQNYARNKDDEEFQLYLKALEVPLGDHYGRLELQSENPDLEKAYELFLIGQNHPDDTPGMMRFFLHFEHFPYMRDAVAIWTEADQLIKKLQELGNKIRTAREADNIQQLNSLLEKLNTLNWQLAKLEYDFSYVLSEGARWVKKVLMITSISLLVIMLIIVLAITRLILIGIVKTENDLLISENRFSSLYHSNMLGIVDWHHDGRILDANEAFLKMIGYQKQDIDNGKLNWRDLTPTEGHQRDNLALNEIEQNGFCTPFEKEFITKSGNRVTVYLGAALLGGEQQKGICFIIDHTEQKRAHTELQLSATVFNASSDGIMITDKDMNIIAINKAFTDMTGYQEHEALGNSPKLLYSGLMPDSFYDQMWSGLKNDGAWHGDIMDRKKDGTIFPVSMSIDTVHDEEHNISHYVAILTDITERKAAEEQLRKLAHYDYLTGLANRSLFSDLLRNAINRSSRRSTPFAVLFIDLDRFKPVNDEFGHEVGDKLLQEIAKRLQATVRDLDTVARLGGDEFVILLEEISTPQDAAIVARKVIEAINKGCNIEGHALQVGGSVGISIYPHDGEDSITILNSADIAMYAAKSSGRNDYFFFNTKINT